LKGTISTVGVGGYDSYQGTTHISRGVRLSFGKREKRKEKKNRRGRIQGRNLDLGGEFTLLPFGARTDSRLDRYNSEGS